MELNTKVLTQGNQFTLTEEYKCLMFSIQVSDGTGDNATYIGNLPDPITKAPSEAIPIAAGRGQVFVSDNPQREVSGITVTAIQGDVYMNFGY